MNYVIYHRAMRGYVKSEGGIVTAYADPDEATRYDTHVSAMSHRPGHHRDMGGSGQSGEVLTIETARSRYRHSQCRC